MRLQELYAKQISLSEWFDAIRHKDRDALRREDNEKRERLAVLNKIIGLPYDKPVQFEANELAEHTPEFQHFLEQHGDELCALRLIPKEDGLPKLRMRGQTVRKVMIWFEQQHIEPAKYRADFVPHPRDDQWGTIFVVGQQGIFGEIIRGGHHQLTQGFHEQPPISFTFDFTKLVLSPENEEARTQIEEIITRLQVETSRQALLAKELQATFAQGYLCGYFETTYSEHGTWFIDYNRILDGVFMQLPDIAAFQHGDLTGRSASPGFAIGRVRAVAPEQISMTTLTLDDVLVCCMTSPDYLQLMQQAGAIITEQGGTLCHAALVARELGKPCIVAMRNATTLLRDGEVIEVDATAGVVRRRE